MAGGLWALSERNAGERRSTYGAERSLVSLNSLGTRSETSGRNETSPDSPEVINALLPRKARVVRRSGEGGGWGERSGTLRSLLVTNRITGPKP